MVASTSSTAYNTSDSDSSVTMEGRDSDRLLGSLSSQRLPKYNSVNENDEHEVRAEGQVDEDEFDVMEQHELEERANMPFYRRPSPWWLIITLALGSTIITTSMAPKIDLFSSLVCEHLKPEITVMATAAASDGIISTTAWKSYPVPSKECVQDAQVQEAVAALNTVLTASAGILGCLTVGWWGQFSDRHGRISMLVLSSGGLLISDVVFLLVTQISDKLPGRYNFLLVGEILGGIFGGVPAFMAAAASYVADTSPPELRARNFSLKTGLLLCGLAFGPSLGSFIVKKTNDLLSVFYLGFTVHVILVLAIPLLVPESLTKASMLRARRRRKERQATLKAQQLAGPSGESRSAFAVILFYLGKIFAFARPLSILLPQRRADGRGWDYNLFLVAITMFLNMLTMGTYSFIVQFLQRAFGWDSTLSGYWFSLTIVSKAVSLTVIIPIIIQIFKPKLPQPIKLSEEEGILLSGQQEMPRENPPNSRGRSSSLSRSKSTHHTASFDYKLTVFALVMEVVTYACMSLAGSPAQFTVAAMVGGLAAGFSPAIKSVAMSLYEQGSSSREGTEVGRLFGALGIVEALSGSALGPILFGSVFVGTVGVLPQAIYMVALGTVALGSVFFLFIRLPRNP